MDAEKMDYSITTDFSLQPEVYRAMLCEQRDSQADNKHLAFFSCGLISRIHRLFPENGKTETVVDRFCVIGILF